MVHSFSLFLSEGSLGAQTLSIRIAHECSEHASMKTFCVLRILDSRRRAAAGLFARYDTHGGYTTMNTRMTILFSATVMIVALAAISVRAQTPEGGFLTDYSHLKVSVDNPFDESYVAPGARERAAQYKAVMIDQPELFIHPSSKYKGMKPDDMKAIADALRESIASELKASGYRIVDQPGPNVMYVRMAVGDLVLQKKRRPILAYTPVGAVVNAAKNMMKDVTSKVDVKNMKIEGEVLDSVTSEQLGAMTASRGSLSTSGTDASKEVSWQELTGLFTIVGKRLRCRLENTVTKESDWDKCGSLGLAAANP
jgi:hypothetical protein